MSLLLLMDDDGPSPAFSANFMSGVLPAGLTYTNSSTTRTYWDAAGTRQAAAANVPVFETLGGVFQGMRWEMEQRTNLATNSEGAAATWIVSNVADAGTPIAGFSASLAFGDNSVGRSARKPITHTSGTTYSISVFVQMDDGLAPVLGLTITSGDFYLAGDAGGVCTLTPTVANFAGSIYRVSAARTATSSAGGLFGVVKATTQSARTFKVIGIQVEAAASASSYIPTADAAVIRQPDVLTATSISPWYRQDEGTVLFEGIHTATDAVDRGHYVFNDGTNANRILSTKLTTNLTRGMIVALSSTQMGQSVGAASADAVFRTAMAYKTNNSNYAVNGTLGTTDTSVTVPTITALTLGRDRAISTGGFFMGYARRFDYYRTRFPDATIQGMSRV